MLVHSFYHLQGIGSATEQGLWRDGLHSWEQALASDRVVSRVGPLRDRIAESVAAWERRDFDHFAKITSGGQAWRWFRELRPRVVYLDIETTGLNSNDVVTVVACYDGTEVKLFVRDDNLGEFPYWLRDHDLLVTYNGATFDVPFLRRAFPRLWVPPVHLDLRYPLHGLGYRGGLKSIERAAGLGRESGLTDIDGWMAVLLWRAHERGDARALPTLLRYAAEDVLGLEPLAELVFNASLARLRPDLAGIAPGGRRGCALPWYPEVVGELLGR